RGEEPFIDANGNGVHDAGEPFTDVAEPFIDFNGNGQFDPPEPFVDANGNHRFDEGETFTDTNGNGMYDDNRFQRLIDVNGNGVWDAAQNAGVWDSDALIWSAVDVTFSGPTAVLLSPSEFTIEDGGSATFTLIVGDADLNPLTGGSTISIQLNGNG